MGQICSLRTTIRHRAGGSGLAHGASTALTNAALSQGKRLHVQCRSDEGRYIRNHNFSCDAELPERAAFNQVPRIVGLPRIDRKGFVVTNIHMGTKEVKPHTQKTGLINAGEETAKSWLNKTRSPCSGASHKILRRL